MGYHYLLSDEKPSSQSARCKAAARCPPKVSQPSEAFCQGLFFSNALSFDDNFSSAAAPEASDQQLQTFLLNQWKKVLPSLIAVHE